MTKSLWTVLGVVVAIIIAWVLVEIVFKLAWLLLKVGLVAAVAIVVFFLLRAAFTRSR